MLTQRSEGLRRFLLICQILLTAGLFWVGVWLLVNFYSPSAELVWRRYSIYCVVLVLGLTLESLGRDNSRDYLLKNELLRQHRLSLRQTFASVAALFVYLIATKDGFISRLFLFNFMPWLYVVLLFSHHWLSPFLPAILPRHSRREDGAGRIERTRATAAWLAPPKIRNWPARHRTDLPRGEGSRTC